MHDYFNNIRIVLVETTHPGNIGAVARAMKTMCHKHLYLVNPKIFPSAETTARATGADDVLADVVVCHKLEEAISDCQLVVGTSARERNISWPVSSPHESTGKILQAAEKGNVAILFGRESSGLSNAELDVCNLMIKIPTHDQFSSLNVAASVQLICYEIMLSIIKNDPLRNEQEDIDNKNTFATHKEMQMFYQHLEQCLVDIDFFDPEKPRLLMRRLKRLFNRAALDQNEMNILRGILSAVQEQLKKNKQD